MKKFLVTDNLEMVKETGSPIISRKDIEIFTASSAEEILNIYRLENVNLIMTDFDLDGSGPDDICAVLKKIRGEDSLNNVSIITICDNEKSAISRAYACKPNANLIKPVDFNMLFREITKFLNLSCRKSHRVFLTAAVQGEKRNKKFFSNSLDISNTGMLFETDEVLEEGDRVRCSFFIGRFLRTINGKIVRVDKKAPGKKIYGMLFLKLDPYSKSKIKEFVDESIKRT